MSGPGRTYVVAVAVLGAGLLALGVIEYHRSSELARAERDRLRAAMQGAATRFADDLDRELAALVRAFRPLPWSRGDDDTQYAAQAEAWATQALDAALVRAVLVADTREGGARLRRLDGDVFTEVPWPPELAPVREALQDLHRRPGPVFVGSAPALVIGRRAPVVLLLDREVLEQRLPAMLAARHFAGLACDVALRRRHAATPGILWTSRVGFPEPQRPVDVVTPVLTVRSLTDGRAPGPPPPAPPERAERPAAWELVVAHEAGSLKAAMTRTRRFHLSIGLGVLVLLGGSAALLVHSVHRAYTVARARAAFVASLSHELRTPLAAVRSAAENLADGVVTDPERVRQYGGLIHREGDRLTALVEHTLELSGLLGHRRTTALVEIDPAALVRDALADVPGAVRVAIDLPAGLPTLVGDAIGLRSALRNLVDNALTHGEGRGVVVRARTAGPAGAQELQLTVEDRGPGLAGERVARLFEPFYRGLGARDRRLPGHGLGLSVVRQVTEAHGGRVSVGPASQGGAIFTLHLPLARMEWSA